MNGADKFIGCRLKAQRQRRLLYQIARVRTCDMHAQHLTIRFTEDHFNKTFAAIEDQCFSIGRQWEAPHLIFASALFA